MSRARGEVIAAGKLAGFFVYDNTNSRAGNKISLTIEDNQAVWAGWPCDVARCTCGQPPTPVVLYVDENLRGFHWESRACLACNCITGRHTRASEPSRGGGSWAETDEEPEDSWTCFDGHPLDTGPFRPEGMIFRQRKDDLWPEGSTDGGITWTVLREYCCDRCGALYWGYIGHGPHAEKPYREPCPACGEEGPHATDTFGFVYATRNPESPHSLQARLAARGRVIAAFAPRIPEWLAQSVGV